MYAIMLATVRADTSKIGVIASPAGSSASRCAAMPEGPTVVAAGINAGDGLESAARSVAPSSVKSVK